MAVSHYVYLLLKMTSKTGVLTFRGDLKMSYDYDQEAIEYAWMTRVPEPSAEPFAATQQLSQSEMAIPTVSVILPRPPRDTLEVVSL
jgi:hypothetical protein